MHAKIKAKISSAVTAQLISAFVFSSRILLFVFYSVYLKIQDSSFFYGCIGQLVLDLVGNGEDQFSCIAAHIIYKTVYTVASGGIPLSVSF